MTVLTRLDSRIDRAEERGSSCLTLAARWDEYLAALGEGRRDDGLALLAPETGSRETARDRELREGKEPELADFRERDHHLVRQESGE